MIKNEVISDATALIQIVSMEHDELITEQESYEMFQSIISSNCSEELLPQLFIEQVVYMETIKEFTKDNNNYYEDFKRENPQYEAEVDQLCKIYSSFLQNTQSSFMQVKDNLNKSLKSLNSMFNSEIEVYRFLAEITYFIILSICMPGVSPSVVIREVVMNRKMK